MFVLFSHDEEWMYENKPHKQNYSIIQSKKKQEELEYKFIVWYTIPIISKIV